MRLFCLPVTSISHLLLLVVAWDSSVRGQLCPAGQITHVVKNQTRCCLPAECEPDHFLTYCERNGTEDTCDKCPQNYGLYKRTSSFAYEPCHNLLILHFGPDKCKPRDESNEEAEEDSANCYCKLESGDFYLKPQIILGPYSNCQPFEDLCDPGYQPTHSGTCKPCPPNKVQDEKGFKLCRPQKNCTALKLETKIPGNSTTQAVCASPPPLPPVITHPHTVRSTTPHPPQPPSTTSTPSDASVRTSVGGENDASLIVVIAVACVVLLVCVLLVLFFAHRKGWFNCILKGKCHHEDMERHAGPGSQMQLSSRDNDNTSDNSCYTCADSCLTSSNKNSSSAAGKTGAGASEPSKGARPLPMLEAFMNMNGKCPQSLHSNGSLSEPLYNSISQDERLKVSMDSMPLYKNTNGYAPPMHGYPNRIHLISEDESDSLESPVYAKVQQRAATAKNGKDRDDFTETDLLLPSTDSYSSGVPTPVSTPVLKGILRNGNNRQDPRKTGEGTQPAGAGQGSVGNRPHLSMLLNATEDTSHLVAEDSQAANVPHLSQLVSAQGSVRVPGPQPTPPPQRQQLVQQQAPTQPEQQEPELRPQRLQQESPLAARLIPVSSFPQQAQLNPSLVQMEELKPVLPLSPGPGPVPTSPTGGTGVGPQSRERSGSPARISPTQQEVRSHGSPNMTVRRPALNEHAPSASPAAAGNVKKDVNGKVSAKQDNTMVKSETGAMKEKEINEETFRKQALPASSPGSEDTMQKSVCASSGLGDSLEFSSPLELPSEEEGRSRTMYRRSNSEASRSVSPVHQLPPSRSISTPEEKHRPFAVVKPMQSDQSLNAMSDSHDRLTELTQQLDAAGRQFPLTSLAGRAPGRQSSRATSDDSEETRPKTPDNLSEEEEDEEEEGVAGDPQRESEGRTQATFFGDNDSERAESRGRPGKGSDSGGK